jgi:hypothetical protein
MSLMMLLKTYIRLKHQVDRLEIERGKDGRHRKKERSRIPPAVFLVN